MAYSKKVLDHFKNPRNQGIIKKADAIGRVGNPVCGDTMKIYLKIGERKIGRGKEAQKIKYIKDIKFETLGCAAAISVSSILTEMVKGKTLNEALKVSNNDIVKELGGLPAPKIHCSMLGTDALEKAIKNYELKIKN